MKSTNLGFVVHPLWSFLRTTFGMDEAFKMFGPYKGANVIPKLLDQYTYEVQMPLVLSNTNYVGTHFGGSLYSMCDPFYMFLLIENLGSNYIVWDKSASIQFLKPGRGTVKVRFSITEEEIKEIKTIVAEKRKTTRNYSADIYDEDGTHVASLQKSFIFV
ncbi:YiiD C-terminal domain-containing protein [Leptospira sp. 96542]|nr:YiiD C-terminal domain-containing protein [Leptospira sp. 96542]